MRVLIVGAGVAGPTLAYFLAKSGEHSITIVEKSDHFLSKGHNIDIRGTALQVIEKMGLLDTLLQRHTSEKGTYVVDSKGRHIAEIPMIPGKDSGITAEYEILRGDLAELLYNASKDLPGVEYLFGTTVHHILSNEEDTSSSNPPVRVELTNGETRDFDLVVAADGQRSKIRAQCFPSDWVTVIDKNMFFVYATIPRLPEDTHWLNYYVAGQSRLEMMRPDNHGTMRAILSKWFPEGDELKQWSEASRGDRDTQMKLVRSVFEDAGWCTDRIIEGMEKSDEYYFQEIQQIRMKKWWQGRIVCIGDAGYAPTPLTGKGTSLALLGAYILAGELAALDPGEHPARGLEGYEKTFKPFVLKIQDMVPSFVPRMMHPDAKWEVGLMNGMWWTMSKLVGNPLFVKYMLSDTSNFEDEGFPLPTYTAFSEQR
ncbi:hypothetical protein BJ742DRAFT_802744 [Cladochytrium replicatum]|nr:hypothetical protein BJ742DRAFT_802744 [Cladochytrium replicatum]